jgi:hypothetical protein
MINTQAERLRVSDDIRATLEMGSIFAARMWLTWSILFP